MPDAFCYLLCFKLCRHNRPGPIHKTNCYSYRLCLHQLVPDMLPLILCTNNWQNKCCVFDSSTQRVEKWSHFHFTLGSRSFKASITEVTKILYHWPVDSNYNHVQKPKPKPCPCWEYCPCQFRIVLPICLH